MCYVLSIEILFLRLTLMAKGYVSQMFSVQCFDSQNIVNECK